MKYEKTLEQAKLLIGERRFADALKICDYLVRSQTDEQEAAILGAACQVCLGCPKKDAKKLEKIRKAVARAFSLAESAEAVRKAELRLLSALSRYRAEQMEASLKKQKEKASLPELKNYFDTALKYEDLPGMLREEADRAITGKTGAAPGAFAEESPEDALNQRLAEQEYEISRSTFGEARMQVQFHGAGTGKAVGELLRQAIEMLTVAQILAARSAMAAADDETHCTRLETEAEILQYGLGCIVHPDGENLSLYSSGREELIEKLKEIYGQIEAIRPDFKAPALPSALPINTVPAKPGTGSRLFGRK